MPPLLTRFGPGPGCSPAEGVPTDDRHPPSSHQQPFHQPLVQPRQRFQIVHAHVLVHLVDAGIDRAYFDALRAQWRDEACIGGAAAGAFFWRAADVLGQHRTRGGAQRAFRV